MKATLPLFVFVDACGWEIIQDQPFLKSLAPHRRKLTSVFGYSSACIPSILSGRWPADHRNWSYFVYDPGNSPFRGLRPLAWLPTRITSRRIVRRLLSRIVKRTLSFRGYFDLYNLPFKHLGLFDFSEKKNPLEPGGLNRGPNIFDHLQTAGIPYHVSDPRLEEAANLDALMDAIGEEAIDFAFLYWPGLDGLLHSVGNDSPEVPKRLADYQSRIERLVAFAREHYQDVRLYVFSDHGMANCDRLLDLRGIIEQLPYRMPRDYAVVYDSTMARFWFFTEAAREAVARQLEAVSEGRIIPDTELKELGAFFPDRYFGELIFLVNEGVLIVPSHMGERPIRGMHGYHPREKHSFAALCSNQEAIPEGITAIPHMYQLMVRESKEAYAANQARRCGASPSILETEVAA
jgi:hypothetical protein